MGAHGARAARSLRGRPVEFDVWNEPDAENFWNGTREQFFQVYAVAARTLVDELGAEAVVGGPSTRAAIPAWVGGLLRYCRRHALPRELHLLPREPPAHGADPGDQREASASCGRSWTATATWG